MCDIGDAVVLAAVFALFGKDFRELAFKGCQKAQRLAEKLTPADARWALKRCPNTMLIWRVPCAVANLLDGTKYRVGSGLFCMCPPPLRRSDSLRDAVLLGLLAGLMSLGYAVHSVSGSIAAFFIGIVLIASIDDYVILRSLGSSRDRTGRDMAAT
jgi:hypothetical protein